MTEEVWVTLSPTDMRIAAAVACERHIQNVFAGKPDRYGAPPNAAWQLHIEGCLGEFAYAKFAQRFWNGNVGDLKAADVGNVQVRASSDLRYRLILHHDDADDQAFVLVLGTGPRYLLRGWCWGREGKREEYWTDPKGGRPAFFVPHTALRPMRSPAKGAAA